MLVPGLAIIVLCSLGRGHHSALADTTGLPGGDRGHARLYALPPRPFHEIGRPLDAQC